MLGIPLVTVTTAADSMWGPTTPELVEALPAGQEVIDRSTVNAWGDEVSPPPNPHRRPSCAIIVTPLW
ncbi:MULTISPECIES: cysteine hydrolase family protein [unclassified Streptomyces]|uniref:hypothetical protein n=1 Tax=unclassified Streptomyces TaxID=2593676 RepID=UPI003438C214